MNNLTELTTSHTLFILEEMYKALDEAKDEDGNVSLNIVRVLIDTYEKNVELGTTT